MLESKPARRKLPQREMEIVGRLKEAREILRFSQTEFARQIGITRHRLASYEERRAPLRWEVALKACRQFFISELWLATGDMRPWESHEKPFARRKAFFPRYTAGFAIDPITHDIKPGMLFSAAFDKHLQSEYFKRLLRAYPFVNVRFRDEDNREFYDNATAFFSEAGKELIHPFFWNRFYNGVMLACIILADEFRRIGGADDAPQANWSDELSFEIALGEEICKLFGVEPSLRILGQQKKNLTAYYDRRNLSVMQSPLQRLLKDVARLTKPKGKKAEVAYFVKVPRPRVSEWLHGKGEPGGESVLRLLEWVAAEEAKQKSPGDAEHTAKGKARIRKSTEYEKRKTGPRQS